MKELEARKRALIAEAEVYRETLKLQAQTLRIYALATQRKMFTPSPANPLLLLVAGPLLKWFLGKRLRRSGNWLKKKSAMMPIAITIFKKGSALLKQFLEMRAHRRQGGFIRR
jgi:hypothetical protein